MYSAIMINILIQLGQYTGTILVTDSMGVMPEYRQDVTYATTDVTTDFLATALTAAIATAQAVYDASVAAETDTTTGG